MRLKFQNVLRTYQNLLQEHPYIMNSITTSTLVGTGDLISQFIIERDHKYNIQRTMRMALFGALIGPVITRWYIFLENKIGPSTNYKKVAYKIFSDQILFAPICNIFSISTIALMEKRDPIKTLKTSYLDVLLANYKIWPLVQLFNFTLVPLHLRTVFVQIIAVGWNTYFMWKLHK